ncbi:MAG: DUF1648 domain-containing protein [Clostridia bacterium]|nr:DUF1648 domain-containing protein [Clostridia bacterium]
MKLIVMITFYFICYIPTLVLCTIIPYITRKTESFGVTITEEAYHTPEVRKLRTWYRNRVLIFGSIPALAALIPILTIKMSETHFLFLVLGTFIQIAVVYFFYFIAHKRMKVLKAEKNWAAGKTQMVIADTSFRKKKVLVSPLWFIIYLLVILATVIIELAFYDKIPDRIPMHYNVHGEIDRWAVKSYKTLLWLPLLQLFITFIMGFAYWTIGKSRQLIDPSSPEKSIEQNRIFRYRWSAFIVFSGLALIIMFSLIQYMMIFVKNSWLTIALPLVLGLGMVAASIILSATTGQGGSKAAVLVNSGTNGKDQKVISRDEDKYWKLGIFYYNPEDPSLFVEKRFGIGMTNNWARPMSWVLILGILAAIIGFSVLSYFLTK